MISRRILRIKILQVLYAHYNTAGSDVVKPAKDLLFSIQKAYDLYYYLLLLIVPVKRFAESRIDLALNKKLPTFDDLHPNTRFIDNKVIQQIENDTMFNRYVNDSKLSWVNHPELIKNLYAKLVESQYYKDYMERFEHDYADDRQLLIDFYTTELDDNEMFYAILEEQSIFWNDDIEYVTGMVIKTIRDMHSDKFELYPMYKSEDDREFAFSLLKSTIVNYDEYHKLIDGHVDNWDIERVAYIDNLVLQMAINELVIFPDIPVKVTFDEYLELAKYYSTPKSSVFINGLLDTLLEELTLQGKIIKTEMEKNLTFLV